jgi:large conductance mechanosensitive channel
MLNRENIQELKPIKLVGGYRQFLADYGVLPLAIGVVVGSAVNDFVKSIVDGLLTPLIALVSPGSRLQNLQFEVHGAVFKIGMVINAALSFMSVFLVVYLVVK